MPIPLLAAMAPELLTAGLGAFQLIQGNKMGNVERPVKEVNPADTEALNLSRTLASVREAPGVAGAKRDLNAATSEALDVARRTGEVDIASIYGNKTKALLDLADTNVNFNMQSMNNLVGELQQYATKQDQVWEYNVNQPYQEQVATSSALKGAGVQNLSGALGDISALGLNKMNLDAFTEMFGKKTVPPTTTVTGNNVDPVISGNLPRAQPNFSQNAGGSVYSGTNTTDQVQQAVNLLLQMINGNAHIPGLNIE